MTNLITKVASLGIAAAIGTVILAPLPALAIDNGPCDHCTMEPIVVKGDRKKKGSSSNSLTIQTNSSGQIRR